MAWLDIWLHTHRLRPLARFLGICWLMEHQLERGR